MDGSTDVLLSPVDLTLDGSSDDFPPPATFDVTLKVAMRHDLMEILVEGRIMMVEDPSPPYFHI